MNNYIHADKLLAEIESRMGDCKLPNGNFPTPTSVVRYEELSCLRNFVASLKQGQPPLPHNVDEAAKEHTRYYIPFDQCDSRDIIRTFKAGAEWMARQFPQGQVEEGLEKEIERIIKDEERFMKFQVKEQLIKYIARHFYELGLNAGKK